MRLLQLSDIHFLREVGGVYDLDRELLWRFMEAVDEAAQTAAIDAVLICGDVAFSGQPGEYARATKFLRDVTSRLQIGQDMVFVIPGNHDIDWGITDSAEQRALRSGFRVPKTDAQRDAALAAAARVHEQAERLMAPLRQYAAFAAQYDCPTSAAQPCWDRFLLLGETVELGIRGINSVLVSHFHDHEKKEPLVVGTGQAMLEPADGRVYLTMCHHPKEWILGAGEIAKRLDRDALVQITGHTHSYGVIETTAGAWLRAGALQPSRREEGWEPQFSILELELAEDEIRVVIEPWAWDKDKAAFSKQDSTTINRPAPHAAVSEDRRAEIAHALAVRQLTVRLGVLSAADILNAVVEAGLAPLSGGLDEPPAILAGEAVTAAEAAGRLGQLWDEMNRRRGTNMENPFS